MSRSDGPLSPDASALIASNPCASAFLLEMRPSVPMDYGKVADHLHGMSAEDRACRFLTAIVISPAVVNKFLERTEGKVTFLAVDQFDQVAGMATLGATGQSGHAEVGISVSTCYRRKGVGSALLNHVVQIATARGLSALHAVTSAQNLPLHRLAVRAGFKAVPYPDDRTLVVLQHGLSDQV